jgi:SecD/SecF fusion protein
MQGKGLIKVFLVLLTLVCLVQMYYFVPTNKVEKAAESFAASASADITDDREANRLYKEARASYLDSMSSETILSVPMLKDYTYSDLKRQQLALGLDLKGGMSSVLQVDLKELLTALAGRNAKDATFVAALERADKAQESSESDFVTLFADAFRAESNGKKLNEIFRRSEALGEINTNTTDGEIIVMLREKANETVSLTYNMLKERINRLGVASPNVSLDAARDLILVELAGIDNPKRAKEIMSATAQLEFWETYRASDPGVLDAFTKADARLAAKGEGETATETKMDSIYIPQYDEDGNVIDSTLELRESTDMFGNTGGPLLSMIDLNGATAQYYPTVMGLVDKNKRDAVMTMLERSDVKGLFPKNSKFMWSYKPYQGVDGDFTSQYELYMIKMLSGSQKAPLEGDVVTSATQSMDGSSGQTNVSLSMDARGAKKWAELTTKAANAGNREIAIALDNQVVSAPSVNGAITGGQSSITGNFTVQEAVDFANILEVGKLPAKTKIIQSTTVGPSLGQKNIDSSLKSLLVGVGLLLVFMVLYYGGAGIVSILALLLNVFFIFGSLSSFGTVLTLPGIAGIVLTIGMAVDANVIIFERVKEELRAGKSLLAAINDGFKNSYSAIIDANVTTILVAIVLAYFGLGPIKGFAVVLIIGVLSSLFTAVLVGRMMIDWWTSGKGNSLSFWNGWSKNAFANLNVDWIGKRKIAYTISSVLIVAGLASIFTRGFDLGVEFKGGYSYNIEFGDADVTSETITTELASVYGDNSYIVKQVDGENTYNVVTSYLIDEEGQEADDQAMEALYNGVKSMTGGDFTLDDFSDASSISDIKVTSTSKVEPTIADDIKNSSGWAGGFALLLIFLYIFLRFSKWQYSLGAVAALFHDSIIVLGLFSLLKGVLPFALEINQAFIAAILTVIGYSINDTVVVFDRIREFLGIYTNKSKDEVLNMAINSTFSRTIVTSLTTLIVVLVLLIFGGGAIKGFAFALLIGILVGTYSSIFVATPIVRDFSDDLHAKKASKSKDSGKTFGRAKAAASS